MRTFPNLMPWMGTGFWILLWLWILFWKPPSQVKQPQASPRDQADVELTGLVIRQKTEYTDDKITWMDLTATDSKNLEGSADSHLLRNVVVKVVIKNLKKETPPTEESLTDLSANLDIAWLLIRSDRGVYSFRTNNIELEGNAEIYGYTADGNLIEWLSADKIIYDAEKGEVRSDGFAVYQGRAIDTGRPLSGQFSAGLDLSEAVIDNWRELPPGYRTPFNDPSLKPPYDPPEALKFLSSTESS